MEIIVAKKAGFCFGVRRAVDTTFKLAEEGKEGIFTFGPLIHNPQVVDKLKNEGVSQTDDISSKDIKTLIIRTHGVSPDIYTKARQVGYKLIDATCPFVKKAQSYAKTLSEEGYQVLIIGDREHPEVQGLIGFAGDDVVTVSRREPLPPIKKKVGIIVQTTQPFEVFKDIVDKVISTAMELKIYNTICDYTARRVEETKELSKKVDVMIVVGGKNSANTTQLVNISKQGCENVFHIETSEELDKEWFAGVEKAGITGGASTPQWIIDDVVKKIKEISFGR
ncbi:MAG: 4-hydroxy-3-methylbut-2-enyl diphosphate reductase [Nitrospirae bacterium]|nr:4-hydroxy-3-methylbut-2-enyl diphosphate reductase [Nitrospirota bacterium]